jgi:Protein-tyrosine phosphatase
VHTSNLPPTPERPFANTYWVIPGRLLAGEYPGGSNDMEALPRLASLHSVGINSFIDLTEEGELPPYRHLLTTKSRHFRSAIVDAAVPNNVSQVRHLLMTIQEGLDQRHGLYVHCRAGIGRTGLVIGCFLAHTEGDGKKALKLLNRLWTQSERAKQWPKVPQTAAQANYVKQWMNLSSRTF